MADIAKEMCGLGLGMGTAVAVQKRKQMRLVDGGVVHLAVGADAGPARHERDGEVVGKVRVDGT